MSECNSYPQLTHDEVDYLIAHYDELGPTKISKAWGLPAPILRKRMQGIRERLANGGSAYPREWVPATRDEELAIDWSPVRYYGVVHRPNTHLPRTFDPRPEHLVITDQCRQLVGAW